MSAANYQVFKNTRSKKPQLLGGIITKQKPWVTPSETMNYMIGDPICDYFDVISNKKRRTRYSLKHYGRINEFTEVIMEQGNKFEDGIVDVLRKLPYSSVKICHSRVTPRESTFENLGAARLMRKSEGACVNRP